MIRETSQPSSGACQSTDTDTSSEVTQSSTSGQTVDPSQQIQSSEEERNDSVTETIEPSRNGSTSEYIFSGILGDIDESISSEPADSSSQQAVSGEWEIVEAGELSRAHQSANSDIPRNTSQSSSSRGSTSSAITQQNLVSKEGMESDAASPRDISRSLIRILDRQRELVEATLLQRAQRRMNVISQTTERGNAISESTSNARSNDETQSTANRLSEDLNRVLQQISLNEQLTIDAISGISEQGDEIHESTDRAAPPNKTHKPVNRRPEDSAHECRSRRRHSKRSKFRKDSRSNQTEEASAITAEDMVKNAIRTLNEAIVRNPMLRYTGVLENRIPLVTRTKLPGLLAECQTVGEMRDVLERLELQEYASDDPNSEERQDDTQNDRQNDRRAVRGRRKQRFRKNSRRRGGGGGGVK